jgi:diguanylate cyclase (GGDEF)-like protein/PAS domain S-box-containing protein
MRSTNDAILRSTDSAIPASGLVPAEDEPLVPAEEALLAQTGRRAAAALLREHPDAVLYAQTADGRIVPPPASIGVDGYAVLVTEGRTGLDLCVAEERMTMVNAWVRAKEDGVAEARGHLRSDPDRLMVLRMFDLRDTHGVVLSVVWPAGETPEAEEPQVTRAPLSCTPRFCTRKQDEDGNVFDCDDAYLQMFGYSAQEVIGNPTFERVHPEDQARVIEGWIAAVASGRVQMFRIRMKRKDGSWLWVDTTLHNFLGDEDQPHVLAECIDVSAEMVAQEALQDREELLRTLIEELPDGLLQLDSERNVVYHNVRLLEVLHGSSAVDGVRSQSVDAVESPRSRTPVLLALEELLKYLADEARQTFDAVVERALKQGVREDVEVDATLPFGAQQTILIKVRPLQRESGLVTGVIASVLDVTDSTRARRELERRATFDALTGAHNRNSIMAVLAAELETSSDTGVAYVDLDGFKSVNDSFGHAVGDEVLAQVVERLKAAMRSSDEIGRLGGDEFLIVLRGVSGLGVALSAAQRISESVRGSYELACGNFELCASVGVACVDDRPATAEALVERADAAMYRSKEQRRGVPVLAA